MLLGIFSDVKLLSGLVLNNGINNFTFSLMLTHWNEYHDNNIKSLFNKFDKVYISDSKIAESVKLKEEVDNIE